MPIRTPNYEGTTSSGDWERPAFEDYVEGYFVNNDADRPDEEITSVEDAPQALLEWAASLTFAGDSEADTYSNDGEGNGVVILPAVEPDTMDLHEDALMSVVQFAPQTDGLSEADAEEIQERARELLEDEFGHDFDDEEEESISQNGQRKDASMPSPTFHAQDRDEEVHYRQVGTTVRKSSDDERLTVTINTTDVDRHRTIILPEGAMLGNYNENPVVLINHDHRIPAATSSVNVRGDGFDAVLQANIEEEDWDLEDDEVARWKRKIDKGIIQSASIGAIFHERVPGHEFDGIEELLGREVEPRERLPDVITKWELVEWSFVAVPSNPGATMGWEEGYMGKGKANHLMFQRLLDRVGQIEQRISESISPTEQDVGKNSEAASAAPESSVSEADRESPEEAADSVPEKPDSQGSEGEAVRQSDEKMSGGLPDTMSPSEAEVLVRKLVPIVEKTVDRLIDQKTGRA